MTGGVGPKLEPGARELSRVVRKALNRNGRKGYAKGAKKPKSVKQENHEGHEEHKAHGRP
jgi:hypothetical protein